MFRKSSQNQNRGGESTTTMSFLFHRGTSPILISFPHNGSQIPVEIAESMTPQGKASRDTDWFLDQLYSIDESSDASRLVALESRYVVDLNRSSTDDSLYPGQNTTGLTPIRCFDGSPIYLNRPPSTTEIQRRVQDYWLPYHTKLDEELCRLKDDFGLAVLVEAHSIASRVPLLFDGKLPDFNLGTSRGESCNAGLLQLVSEAIETHPTYTQVSNGRFIGGYITRHFGRPAQGVHALQIELSQATYLNESTLQIDSQKFKNVQPVFRSIFKAINSWIQRQID